MRKIRANEERLVAELVKQTSRSFNLTLSALPRAIRFQIRLAYLLARTTDTIADTEIIPPSERVAALNAMRDRISGARKEPLDFRGLAQHQGSPAERVLLEKCEVGLALLKTLSPEDLARVTTVLNIIISGQEEDLRRFAGATAAAIMSLQTDSELDDYTYRVAGCVGEFWTRMCRAHLFPRATLDEEQFLADGVRFGKGLQLINILRDLPVDLRKGRCYLPSLRLEEIGFAPADLLLPGNEQKFRKLYDGWLELAEGHLAAGWRYTNTLPRNQRRVRLACAWPILIGAKTLGRLRVEPVLDPARRVKISRQEVRGIVWNSLLALPFAGKWRALYDGKSVV